MSEASRLGVTQGGPKTNLIRKIEVAIYGLTAAEPQNQTWRENRGLRAYPTR